MQLNWFSGHQLSPNVFHHDFICPYLTKKQTIHERNTPLVFKSATCLEDDHKLHVWFHFLFCFPSIVPSLKCFSDVDVFRTSPCRWFTLDFWSAGWARRLRQLWNGVWTCLLSRCILVLRTRWMRRRVWKDLADHPDPDPGQWGRDRSVSPKMCSTFDLHLKLDFVCLSHIWRTFLWHNRAHAWLDIWRL